MNAPAKFLTSLAQSLSTMMLYPREHPTWKRAADASFTALVDLQKENPHPVFSFIGRDIVYGESPLHDLKDWPWAQRLAEVGVGRLEFEAEVTHDEFEEFIADVLGRMVQSGSGNAITPAPRTSGRQSIRFGAVTVREVDDGNADLQTSTREPTPSKGMEGAGWPTTSKRRRAAPRSSTTRCRRRMWCRWWRRTRWCARSPWRCAAAAR